MYLCYVFKHGNIILGIDYFDEWAHNKFRCEPGDVFIAYMFGIALATNYSNEKIYRHVYIYMLDITYIDFRLIYGRSFNFCKTKEQNMKNNLVYYYG